MKNLLIVLGVLAAIAGFIFVQYDSFRRTGVGSEQEIMAQENSYKIERSNYESGFYEMLGVEKNGVGQVSKILNDTMSARSAGEQAATGGRLVSAVREAYPDLRGVTDLSGKIMDYVKTSREKMAQEQKRLNDRCREYKTFLTAGALQPMFCQWSGLPTTAITCEGPDGQELTGQKALDWLARPITTSATDNASRTRRDEPLKVPSNNQ